MTEHVSANASPAGNPLNAPAGLTMVAVADLCAQVSARSANLFAFCGVQTRSGAPGRQQRWWARACHQHVWHLQLATDRMPTIPLVDATAVVDAASQTLAREAGPGDDAVAYWQAQVGALTAELERASMRIDPALDPSTDRLITLVVTDLARLSGDLDR